MARVRGRSPWAAYVTLEISNGPVQRFVIELKLMKEAPEATEAQGLEQTAGYAKQVGADEAHLVLFDRRPGIDWDARIWQREAQHQGLRVMVWGA